MNYENHDKYGKAYGALKNLLKDHPKLLILGIGENRMGDDGMGPWVTFKLSQKISSSQILILNGGIVPEERLQEIMEFQPELVLVVDAAEIEKPPGGIGVYKEDLMLNYLPISSHSLPLPIFMDRIKQEVEGVRIYLLGVQPISMQFSDKYQLFREGEYSLDDKEDDPNIPFYAFNLSEGMKKISSDLVEMILELTEPYS